MSALFFKRFLQRPMQVASIIPSSKALIKKVSSKIDFSEPRIIAEYGPGEGCHTREIIKNMHPGSRMLLFELDPELAEHLKRQFANDSRIEVINSDANNLAEELAKRNLEHCDYVISGIPFSTMEVGKKRALLQKTFDSLAPKPSSAFIIYQVTNELRGHASVFPHAVSEYCLQNIPPMFVTVFYKQLNGHTANGRQSVADKV
jgi:phosphatidylethanolamine/phosphatidyl-N-methylethanolamine N-methyltransferase